MRCFCAFALKTTRAPEWKSKKAGEGENSFRTTMKSISVDRQTTKLICQFDELYFLVVFVSVAAVAAAAAVLARVCVKQKKSFFDTVNRKYAFQPPDTPPHPTIL